MQAPALRRLALGEKKELATSVATCLRSGPHRSRGFQRAANERPCCRATRAINLKPMPTVIPAVQAVLEDLVERDVERGSLEAAYLDG